MQGAQKTVPQKFTKYLLFRANYGILKEKSTRFIEEKLETIEKFVKQ